MAWQNKCYYLPCTADDTEGKTGGMIVIHLAKNKSYALIAESFILSLPLEYTSSDAIRPKTTGSRIRHATAKLPNPPTNLVSSPLKCNGFIPLLGQGHVEVCPVVD